MQVASVTGFLSFIASNSVFTLGVLSVFLFIPLFTTLLPLLQGVSGDILGTSLVDFDRGETNGTRGVMACGSMLYCFNSGSCTYQTGLLLGGRNSFVAIDWILISNWRFEIPEALSYCVVLLC